MLGISPPGLAPIGREAQPPVYRTAALPQTPWILTGVLSNQATITTVGVQQMAVANLQDKDPTKKWRGTGRTEKFLFTFPGPTICNAFAWIGHNHTPGGSLRVLAGDAAAGGVITTVALDTNFVSVWPIGIKPIVPKKIDGSDDWPVWISIARWVNTNPYRYYEVDVGDDGVGIVDLQAGVGLLGVELQPRNNPGDVSLGITNSDFRKRSPWNKIQTSRRLPGRTLKTSFPAEDEDEAIQVIELQRSLGIANGFVLALDPKATSRFHYETIYGTLTATGEFKPLQVWGPRGRQWSFELEVEEL